jgi:hypothetical protein
VGVMVPVLTREALDHVLIDKLLIMGQITVAVQIIVISAVLIS